MEASAFIRMTSYYERVDVDSQEKGQEPFVYCQDANMP